ncbi:nuclease-related domain-containing protein [Levilactobacillus suantsaii]|uniref:NERD domain-containing protein n=1 Tax=Levilactobacillus suantsaii TaxID=2292255 RepID=A0A4Q0VJ72_9LACO|nr:nuclease-related domain-containing protein [Levilactobacillus suantsaii]QMU07299.1 NERD domain-containing protein [Levilactobacillus suantsaii]RXI77904.1 NERD domain-containing protein [Levilactobacillus suantsaii]
MAETAYDRAEIKTTEQLSEIMRHIHHEARKHNERFDYKILRNVHFANKVKNPVTQEMNEGDSWRVMQIDNLLVTSFGVINVESKYWRGMIFHDLSDEIFSSSLDDFSAVNLRRHHEKDTTKALTAQLDRFFLPNLSEENESLTRGYTLSLEQEGREKRSVTLHTGIGNPATQAELSSKLLVRYINSEITMHKQLENKNDRIIDFVKPLVYYNYYDRYERSNSLVVGNKTKLNPKDAYNCTAVANYQDLATFIETFRQAKRVRFSRRTLKKMIKTLKFAEDYGSF